MKLKLLSFVAFVLCALTLNAQTTAVPDANFEQALIDLGHDSDGKINGQVLTSDISGLTSLDIFGKDIDDLTGIEDFISLTSLKCFDNNLKSIDVSKNNLLREFWVGINQLTSLDVSNNLALQSLRCLDNQLKSLDVSNNQGLFSLRCDNNQLESLDLSKNLVLVELHCSNNQLTSLNIKNGNNLAIADAEFRIQNNPNLFCVKVDDSEFSNLTWISYVDTQVEFNENNCNNSLFADYVIIAEEVVKLEKHNNVLSGNIGVTDSDGEAEFRWFTDVEGAVEAKDIYVSNTSSVGSKVFAPADVELPAFLENEITSSNSPDVTVNKNQTVELNGSDYGKVHVKKGGKVVFTNSSVNLGELKVGINTTISFTEQCSNVLINKSLKIKKNSTFNDLEHSVFVYVDDKIEVKENSRITAFMYANNHDIKVNAKIFRRTYMKGLFIGDKVKGKKFVTWNKDESLSPCNYSSNTSATRLATSKKDATVQLRKKPNKPEFKGDKFTVNTWPNPSNDNFSLKVNSVNNSDIVIINVYDINGRLVHNNSFNSEKQYIFGNDLQSGIYVVKIIQVNNISTLRVIKK
jgi:hypothetical protein